MLLLITERRLIARTLAKALSEHGIFHFRAAPEVGAFYCEEKDTGSVILDCVSDMRRSKALCAELRTRYPALPIAALLPPKSAPDLAVDAILRDGDLERICTDALEFCRRCGWDERRFTTYQLTVGIHPTQTRYMGYPLSLSPREHTILRCLMYRSPRLTPTDDLMSLCYPEGRQTVSNLTLHIHNINQLAKQIDPRPLIVNIYGKGYRLRDGIID